MAFAVGGAQIAVCGLEQYFSSRLHTFIIMSNATTIPMYWKEVAFQLVLHGILFLFFSFDKNQPNIQSYHFAFFANYTAAALVINYGLLPRFFYQKKYLHFFLWTGLVITLVILLEETVLEQIYFPDTRGQAFPGLFFTLLQILPIITILSGFKFAWDAVQKQSEVEMLQIAVKESELLFLKSQINPHFLFNNLNNLYAYTVEQSPKAPEIILELSNVLRYMLYECQAAYVPLTKEVQQLENFVKLNELQIEDRGVVHFAAHNIKAGHRIAPLILMVFVENAFKHSTASQSEGILIDIKLEQHEDQLHFQCTNSHSPESNTQRLDQGIGLENVRKRLPLLYPDQHQLDITEAPGQFQVTLNLHLH